MSLRFAPLAAGAALLASAALLAVTACGATTAVGTPQAATSPPDTSGATTIATAAGTAPAHATSEPPAKSPSADTAETASSETTPTTRIVPSYVYYVVDTRTGLRLSRELREIPADTPAAAVEAMITGAADPDYTSTWNPATRVLGVDVAPDLITVNLSNDARSANVGSPGAALMVQQLVWTVTEAAKLPAVPVLLAIDGAPAGELWGAISWSEPIARAEAAAFRTLVQIDFPTEASDVTSPMTVSGDAAAFEATVPWRVLRADGSVVSEGFATASEGMRFAPYSFTLDLPPGTYRVEVREDDPSGGAGGAPMVDTRSFTVR